MYELIDSILNVFNRAINVADNVLTVAEEGSGAAADWSKRLRKAQNETEDLLSEAAVARATAVAETRVASANKHLAKLREESVATE